MGEEELDEGDTQAECVSLVKLSEENLGLLKQLNAVLFPIRYQKQYYMQALASAPFSQLAFFRNTCVGSITCRLEDSFTGKRLYVFTLGVLAPYRRMGIEMKKNLLSISTFLTDGYKVVFKKDSCQILSPNEKHYLLQGEHRSGSKLMKFIMELAEDDGEILDVYLHVQVNNEEALQFYQKFGFEVRDLIRNYYRRIDPPDCFLLSKELGSKKDDGSDAEVPISAWTSQLPLKPDS
ncbi:hypothetical protein KP509_10G024900 [Ceratopteris richardii]|uniref:N-acetyltransferase domain-containing protein n=1 Tax=Ceratopteris richardii TaxID=49495 RepID=A0A8T2TZ85_CERRI|nr:hypothetical protein KP509_10G024900 [Ceratopteris richardii]